MIKYFRFLTDNKDVPTRREIDNSVWLTAVYKQGFNARINGDNNIPVEYNASKRTLHAWNIGYNDADISARQ